MEERKLTFGIREVELIREPDKDGESFYFKVNGLPVFMKGANYIPQDNFLPRVDSSKYEALIQSVVEANMNMLRVWGGGVYERKLFYDLCDKNGILVWQDFMFACNMYPGDDDFLASVKQEAIDNVKRLSNHPCIALWCGNNEVDEGWHNWGWQKALEYSDEDSAKVWKDYLEVFHGILPEIVEQYDPGTIYHPSSPMTGWGREEAYKKGDVHYWGVWWGEYPFYMYREKVGRFISEYGFQGMPPMETIESFGGINDSVTGDRQPETGILESHQKHPRGTELIRKYMERDYNVPEKFEDYVYISQVLQAEGMAQAFLTHRISQPYCMGTLYWQLNDCWPVTSWSGLDYYGRWKALHYHVKRAYAPLMITSINNNGINEVYVINDHPYDIAVEYSVEFYSVDELLRVNEYKKDTIPALSSKLVSTFRDPEKDRSRLFAKQYVFNVSGDSEYISDAFTYFVPPKNIELPKPDLIWEVEEGDEGPVIVILSNTLARQVFLETDGLEGRFSDNFFDMAPEDKRWIKYLGEESKEELEEKLKIKSIYDTYN